MEIGKYISLGNSISVKRNKDDTYTYFHSKKINGSSKRIKLFVKEKHSPKHFKESILMSNNQEIEEVKKKYTLNQLSDEYFKSRTIKKTNILRQTYNNLSDEEFKESKIVKKRLSSIKTEIQKYNKNVRGSELSNLDVTKMDRKIIKTYTDEYLSEKGLGEKSTYHIISLIKTIFNYSIRNDLIDIKNPFQNIVFKNPKKTRVRYLSEKELTLLLKTCKEYESNPNVYLVTYLLVITAARAQMVLNIKKKDIDVKNGHIKLSNFKSNKYYTISLNKESINWLDKKILQHIDYNDYLIQPTNLNDRKQPQQPLSEVPEKIYKIMDELFNQGIDKSINDERDNVVNVHTIRRSIATNLALNNASIYDIMTLLNHSSIKQTQDYLSLNNQ